jgi:hypothetical protein
MDSFVPERTYSTISGDVIVTNIDFEITFNYLIGDKHKQRSHRENDPTNYLTMIFQSANSKGSSG